MDLLTFLLAVLLLELIPGPNMAYLATLALSRGRTAGLIATAGVAFGLAVHAMVAGLGAGVLIGQYPLLYDVVRWIGVGYLLYLAWEGWRTEKETSPERADLAVMAGPLFARGFFSNVFNPKSILFFVSVLPTFVGTGPGAPSLPTQMAVFGILYVGVATAVHARDYRNPRRAATALAGGGSATTDCAPYSIRDTRPGRNLAGMDDAALTGSETHTSQHAAQTRPRPGSAHLLQRRCHRRRRSLFSAGRGCGSRAI